MNNISEGDESPSPFNVNVVVWTDYYTHLTIAQAYDIMQTIPKKGNKKRTVFRRGLVLVHGAKKWEAYSRKNTSRQSN